MSLRPVFARLRASARLFSRRLIGLNQSLRRLLVRSWVKPRAGLPLRFRLTADPCEAREMPGSLWSPASFPGLGSEFARPAAVPSAAAGMPTHWLGAGAAPETPRKRVVLADDVVPLVPEGGGASRFSFRTTADEPARRSEDPADGAAPSSPRTYAAADAAPTGGEPAQDGTGLGAFGGAGAGGGVDGAAAGADPAFAPTPGTDTADGDPAPKPGTGGAPRGPGGDSAVEVPGAFGHGLAGWEVFQDGGSTGGKGTVALVGDDFVLREGDSFDVGVRRTFTLPATPSTVVFKYADLGFDTAAKDQIKDAFEVSLVTPPDLPETGFSVVPTHAPTNRDSYFNVTDGAGSAYPAGVTESNGLVTLDVSKLAGGSRATIEFRLVNNDSDTNTSVRILGYPSNQPPAATVGLANDTAPDGPAGDPYRTDTLTNDPTVTGTALDDHSVSTLQAKADGGAFADITSQLQNGAFTWYPGALPPGPHTVTVRATDGSGLFTDATTAFTVNTPPSPNAGPDKTTTEGQTLTFDGSGTTDPEGVFEYLWTFPDGTTATGKTAAYTFPQDGTYTVRLKVTDTAGSVAEDTAVVTVGNVSPTILTFTVTPAAEGSKTTATGAFTDPGLLDSFKAAVNWGDNVTTDATVTPVAGGWRVDADHVYADNKSTWPVTLSVTDQVPPPVTKGATADVPNVPPAVSANPLTVTVNQPFTLPIGTFTDPGWTPPSPRATQETFTATVDWNINDPAPPVTAAVSASAGPDGPSVGAVTGGPFTYTAAGTYTARVKVTDDDGGSGAADFTVTVGAEPVKFYVVDQSQHETFRYGRTGNYLGVRDQDAKNDRPRGIAANAAGTQLWVVDAAHDVFWYTSDNVLLGHWVAGDLPGKPGRTLNQPQDIATDGTNVWVVDDAKAAVFYYPGAATATSGTVPAARVLTLNAGNDNPSGIVYRNGTLWVVNDGPNSGDDRVFAYSATPPASGDALTLTGGFRLKNDTTLPQSMRNTDSRGVTLVPGNNADTNLWVVDRLDSRVYRYALGTTYMTPANVDQVVAYTDSFALTAADNFAEGIADPPAVTASATGPAFGVPAGSPVVVQGTAADAAGRPALSVTVNGTPAPVLDAAGHFFGRYYPAAGDSRYVVVAADATGPSAPQTVTVTGRTVPASGPDFALLSDVTPSFRAVYGRTSLDQRAAALYAGFRAENVGTYAVGTPVLAVVRNISIPGVRVVGADGVTPDGDPYFDLTGLFTGSQVNPGDLSQSMDLTFDDPAKRRFTYEVRFLAPVNHAPYFTSAPKVRVPVGRTYKYDADAADPDKDPVGFSIAAGPTRPDPNDPAGMTVDAGTGLVTWTPDASQVGTHYVQLKADDGRGGFALQTFVVEVPDGSGNGPPVFVTPPVVDAYVNVLYDYGSEAEDPDLDDLTYSLEPNPLTPPGLTVDPVTGDVRWTPPADYVGKTVPVTLKADDGHDHAAYQPYQVKVWPEPGNHPPVIVSTPRTKYVVPTVGNPPDGAVDPDRLDLRLRYGESVTKQIGVTLGNQTTPVDKVDVFLLMDDTGSFQGFGPVVQGQFPGIISQLQNAFPQVSFAFGVGRFEDYHDTSADDRPFVLNQPVLTTSTAGFSDAINAALGRTSPGNGADTPEGDIEALRQLATGAGFDGNVNDADGSTGEGPAGALSTQITTQYTGDVPAFATFTPDPANHILAPSGTRGGVGFRTGALPIALLATDTGTNHRYDPAEGSTVYGAGGASVPYDRFEAPGTSGHVAPPNGATVQEAIAALNKLGVQVIGLGAGYGLVSGSGSGSSPGSGSGSSPGSGSGSSPGSGSGSSPPPPVSPPPVSPPPPPPLLPPGGGGLGSNVDPRQTLEAIATLTGAVNRTNQPIDSQVPGDPIDPGDPLFFQISQDSGPSVGQGIIAAITAAVNGALTNVDAIASDPTFHNDTGIVYGVGSNQTATFDATFTGDGTAHTFDVQFVPAGGGTLLGSIPVTVAEPYESPVYAIDPDGDPITYAILEQTPDTGATLDAKTGALHWEPTAPGSYYFKVQASDGRGGIDVQEYTVVVTQVGAGDQAPVIDTAALPGATAGQPYSVRIDAHDPDADPLWFYVTDGPPQGVTMDRLTGWVSWLPTPGQAGTQSITVRVFDPAGKWDKRTYTVAVAGPSWSNDNPDITTTHPTPPVAVGGMFQYDADATDPNSDPLVWDAPVAPAGMTVDKTTGLLVWEPTADQVGVHSVLLRVVDGRGGVDLESFKVTVTPANRPPVFVLWPAGQAAVGYPYKNEVAAIDPDGDAVEYYPGPDAPAWLAVDKATGAVSGTPTGAAGTITFTILAKDVPAQATATQPVTLELLAAPPPGNQPPEFGNFPREKAQVGTRYVYDYKATDPDGDPVFDYLDGTIPGGLTFEDGILSWTPSETQQGTYSFTARIEDVWGNTATLPFTVTVSTGSISNDPPHITTTPDFSATDGLRYEYEAAATDPNGDPVLWSFDQAPPGAVVDARSGVVAWVPTDDQVGQDFPVALRAEDPYGGAEVQSFKVHVYGVNRPPQITSTGPGAGTIGDPYFYPVRATDPDADPVAFKLFPASLPGELDPLVDGAKVDQYGLVTWTPGAVATYRFGIEASDGRGGVVDQVYTVAVGESPVNRPPYFLDFDVPPAVIGRPYALPTKARDPDGNTPLTYGLDEGPGGSSVDSAGVIHWPSPAGTVAFFTAKVYDPSLLWGGVRIGVPVRASNAAPTIAAAGPFTVSKGAEFDFDVPAEDADDPITSLKFTLTGLPAEATIDSYGRVRWTTATAGYQAYTFTVKATDPVGDSAQRTFTVTVGHDTTAPTVTVEPSPNPDDVGSEVSVRVSASDDVGVASRELQAFLGGAWKVIALDAANVGRFTPTAAGMVQLKATATDAEGNEGAATGSVRVVTPNDAHPPVAVITGPPAGSPQSGSVTFTGTADDPEDNLVSWDLDVRLGGGGAWLPVGSGTGEVVNGPLGTLSLADLPDGTYDVRLTAADATHTAEATSQFVVSGGTGWTVNPSDTTRPNVAIAAPADGATVSGLVDVIGTVDDPDDHLVSWKLEGRGDGSTTWATVATGTSEVANTKLGQLDPTVLRNGLYTLRLTALDQGGSAMTSTTVTIDGQRLKLGNFRLTVKDLTVPVAGIPITISRQYDTLDADTQKDFAYAWTLRIGAYEAFVDPATVGPNYDGYPAFVEGQTRVYVVHEDGTRDGYTFYGKPGQTLFGIPLDWRPAFAKDPGVLNDLEVDPADLIRMSDGTFLSYDGYTYSPANPAFGGAYDVKERGGITYSVDAATGEMLSAKNRNGVELEIRDDGIFSNRGRAVTFDRDYRGRITAVTDPKGHSVTYQYDPQTQDLVSVYDRTGVKQAGYTYRTDVPHYLATITDAFGTTAVQAQYDPASKRVSQLTDAAGRTQSYGYAVAGPSDPSPERGVQTITSDDGNPATNDTVTVAVDKRGNLLRGVDQQGREVSAAYADPAMPDAPTKTTQVIGQQDSPQNGETDDLYTDITYDPNSGMAASTSAPYHSTDPASGKGSVSAVYNSLGLPTFVSDPLGNTTSAGYDAKGNLTYARSPGGVATSYGYDADGNLTSTTRNGVTAKLSYDSFGQVTKATDPSGNETRYVYDDNGNGSRVERDWYADPVNKAGKVTVVSRSDTDFNDRPRFGTDPLGNQSETVYDKAGRAQRWTDPRGNVVESVYDKRGLAVEIRNPDGTVSRTAYDAAGRPEYVTEPFVVGQAAPVLGSHNVYDAAGRTVRVERLVGLDVSVTVDGNGLGAATVTNAGTVRSASETAYDAAGRVDSTTGFVGTANAAKTRFEYDSAGRRVATVTYTKADFSAFVRTETVYDKAGRSVFTRDPAGVQTKAEYDGDGRVTKMLTADGTSVTTGYDANGRRSFEVDEVGQRTDFGYDARGQLVSVLQPAVFDPVSGTTKRPETKYGYDAYGSNVSITDANGHVTAFAFDELGRPQSRTLPAVGGVSASESRAYDKYGALDYAVDFVGQKQDFVYDYELTGGTKLGRLARLDLYDKTGAKVETVAYTYDPYGRPDTLTETKGATVRVTDNDYDGEGRLVKVTRPEGAVNYAYDAVTGRLTKMWTDKTEADYAYDVLGRLKTVSEAVRNGAAASTATAYTYDAVGNVGTITVTDGGATRRVTTNTFDPVRHFLTGVENKDGSGAVLSTFAYTRRGDGFVTQLVESVKQPTGTSVSTTATYTYDALGRLTKEVVDTSAAGGDYAKEYTLDLVGSRTKLVVTNEGQSPVTTTYGYDARDRLLTEVTGATTVTYGYDANGALVMKTGGGENATYTWDVRGRLVGATVNGVTASYTYTPDGIRSSVTENGGTVLYLIDGMSPSGYAQVIEERASGLLVASYVYGVGLDPVSMNRDTNGSPPSLESVLFLADGHSGVRQLVSVAPVAAVLAAYRYDAFGAKVATAGTIANPVGYRGERLDATLGQYYLRARFYDPRVGRFTKIDPAFGTYSDPLQAMRYGYGRGNPLMNADPSGRFSLSVSICIGIGVGLAAGLIAYFGFGMTLGQSILVGVGFGLAAFLLAFGGPALWSALFSKLAWASIFGKSGLGLLGVLTGLSTLKFLFSYWFTMNKTEVEDGVANLTPGQANNQEARNIGRAIANTYNNNWGFDWRYVMPWPLPFRSEQSKGHWCYEWAYAFKNAFDLENQGNYAAEVQSAECQPDENGNVKVHYWLKIRSNATGNVVYVDDGFWDGKYVHDSQPCHDATKPPGPSTYRFVQNNSITPNTPDVDIPPAYDASGQRR